jgi:hypothetical protein
VRSRVCLPIVMLALVEFWGCKTKEQTGALAGAGVGALIGQVAGKDTASTLIGAGIGAGVGYIIGDKADEADVKKREKAMPAELIPLAGTEWQLISVDPPPERPVKSLVARFNADGKVSTTRVFDNGKVENASEAYRVVGDTLIVNRPGYIINAKFRVEGDRMYLGAGDFSAVLQRV